MIKFIIHHIKLLLLILLDFLFRLQKYIKFIWFGKHEIQRICEDQSDIYEKCMKIDLWLTRTNCKAIRSFLDLHFVSGNQLEITNSLPRKAISKILFDCRKNETQVLARPSKRKGKSKNNSGNNNNNYNNNSYQEKLVNLEDGDIILSTVLRELTAELTKVIEKAKNLQKFTTNCKNCLRDILYRILSYKMSLMLAEQIAATKYDAELGTHTDKLISLWNNLVKVDRQSSEGKTSSSKAFPLDLSSEINDKSDIVSHRWSHIGFQGEDPGTDFRGMGLLGLAQLEYLSRKPKRLARDLLKRSLNEEHSYPFAIVGINITFNLLGLFRDNSMKHLYYDTGDILFSNKQRTLNLLTTFNDLYVELFLRFDCFWHESKPETIFAFKALMEKFINIMRIDLCNRNFSFKFIY